MNNQLTNILPTEKTDIEKCILTIRGKQVMLDSDIARLFKVETRILNQQMKRNVGRFPEDFCFQLNSNEFKNLTSQNVISSVGYGGRRFYPYAYTEHGIIALAAVLKSEVATKMSVEIVRQFVQMRKFIMENNDTLLTLAKLQNRQLEFEDETNKKFNEILKLIIKADLPKEKIFSAGEFFDTYEFISSIIRRANSSIVLIDPYCDAKALTFLKNKKEFVSLTIYSSEASKLQKEEIEKYESQYGKIDIKLFNDIHDRYLILDREECYNLGASLNYAGKKMFGITKIDSRATIDFLLQRVEKLNS